MDEQFNLGTDQYPRTLDRAHELLTEHEWDAAHHNRQKNKKKSNNNDTSGDNQSTRSSGTQQGSDDGPPSELELSFANFASRKFCFVCGAGASGKPDDEYHHMSNCKETDKPRNQWYVNKMKEIRALNNLVGEVQQQQSDQVSEMTESKASQGNKTKEAAPRGWGFAMFEKCFQLSLNLANVSKDMKNEVCLDSGSTVTIFCDNGKVSNIQKSDRSLTVDTNGGEAATYY